MTRKLNARQFKALIKEELRKLKEDTIAQIETIKYCECGGDTWSFHSESGVQQYDCSMLCGYVMMGNELPGGINASKVDKGDFVGNAGLSGHELSNRAKLASRGKRKLRTNLKETKNTMAKVNTMERRCDCDHDGFAEMVFWNTNPSQDMSHWTCANLCSGFSMGTVPDGINATRSGESSPTTPNSTNPASRRDRRAAFKDMTSLQPIKNIQEKYKGR